MIDLDNEEIVDLLLENDAIVNLKRRNGETALHASAESPGGANIIDLLIEYSAEIDLQNEYGLTPLHLATYFGIYNLYTYLIQIMKINENS